MLKVGVSDRIVAEGVFEEEDGCVVKDEVGELMGGERCRRTKWKKSCCWRMKWTCQYLPIVLKGSNPRLGKSSVAEALAWSQLRVRAELS